MAHRFQGSGQCAHQVCMPNQPQATTALQARRDASGHCQTINCNQNEWIERLLISQSRLGHPKRRLHRLGATACDSATELSLPSEYRLADRESSKLALTAGTYRIPRVPAQRSRV